jgi:hypothetical protein
MKTATSCWPLGERDPFCCVFCSATAGTPPPLRVGTGNRDLYGRGLCPARLIPARTRTWMFTGRLNINSSLCLGFLSIHLVISFFLRLWESHLIARLCMSPDSPNGTVLSITCVSVSRASTHLNICHDQPLSGPVCLLSSCSGDCMGSRFVTRVQQSRFSALTFLETGLIISRFTMSPAQSDLFGSVP